MVDINLKNNNSQRSLLCIGIAILLCVYIYTSKVSTVHHHFKEKLTHKFNIKNAQIQQQIDEYNKKTYAMSPDVEKENQQPHMNNSLKDFLININYNQDEIDKISMEEYFTQLFEQSDHEEDVVEELPQTTVLLPKDSVHSALIRVGATRQQALIISKIISNHRESKILPNGQLINIVWLEDNLIKKVKLQLQGGVLTLKLKKDLDYKKVNSYHLRFKPFKFVVKIKQFKTPCDKQLIQNLNNISPKLTYEITKLLKSNGHSLGKLKEKQTIIVNYQILQHPVSQKKSFKLLNISLDKVLLAPKDMLTSPMNRSMIKALNPKENNKKLKPSIEQILNQTQLEKNYKLNKSENKSYARGVTRFIRPIVGGYISSPYGIRKDPFKRKGRFKFHKGIDIATSYNAPVYAVDNGVVIGMGYFGGYGNCIILEHFNGLKTRYAHLANFKVFAGQLIKRGQMLARVGSTGRSTSPHLHFEVIKNNKPVNPNNYF